MFSQVLSEKAFEQKVELRVGWDAVTFIWLHSKAWEWNVLYVKNISLMLIWYLSVLSALDSGYVGETFIFVTVQKVMNNQYVRKCIATLQLRIHVNPLWGNYRIG